MKIESKRLKFRRYKNDDFDFLLSLLTDAEMVRYIGEGRTRNREDAKKFLERIHYIYEHEQGLGLMILEDKETGSRIGHAGLVPQTVGGRKEVEIGYWISRAHWGKGYATEAAIALRDHGFDVLNEKRLIALIQPGNIASIKVAEKVGMALEKKISFHGQHVHLYSISNH
ncbi:GNAT family N-acetyltransferase [Salinicoccus sp. ID82-1]|uniref:GNAT family N-acetyltransferase n=1 Tax=Salinicoccus sp. ID82-1 TaxID=2820269 RepID=UPI001F3606D2|nr:GNAT family N-acetyltransferase [Salinicoccus sp. ID82-1]MCG1008812.1 GNAT family N-acetyltransferase [Salinicoccus sp. ID82-1]